MTKALAAMIALASLAACAAPITAQSNRLVGFGCGPDRLTLAAPEEDEFPAPCEAIEKPADVCGAGVSADDCAAYMGNGY